MSYIVEVPIFAVARYDLHTDTRYYPFVLENTITTSIKGVYESLRCIRDDDPLVYYEAVTIAYYSNSKNRFRKANLPPFNTVFK